jgi:hypothetical protein
VMPIPGPVGGCSVSEFGCCDDGKTAANANKSNCHSVMPIPGPVGGCSVSKFGCCDDGITPANANKSNCHSVMPVRRWDCVLDDNNGASRSCKQTDNGPYTSLKDCVALAKCYQNWWLRC